MTHKIFRAPFKFKQDEEDSERGEFTAVFSTLNVIDLDDDVTEPGAFKDGQPVIIEPWNHSWNLPVGKGLIKSDDKKAWVEGRFFLDTEAGRENYLVVKNLGDLAEWSYTFDIVDSGMGEYEGNDVHFLRELDVVGVSPVTRGAGIDTETMDIKGQAGEDSSKRAEEDETGDGEGEAGSKTSNDGKPSGVGPEVIKAQIDIEILNSNFEFRNRKLED